MATGNFATQKNFPLIVANDDAIREYLCLGHLTELEDFDYIVYFENLKAYLEELNTNTELFEITIENGYYEGIQLWIFPKHYGCETVEKYVDFMLENIESYEDKQEYHDDVEYYSEEFEKELSQLFDNMEKIKNLMNMFELEVVARFSNGETLYDKVPS